MKTKAKRLSDSRVEITVTLDKDDLKKARDKALEKLAKTVNVSGFRKGKVPTDVAEKFIPENDLNAETIDYAVRSTVIEAFREEEKSPLAIPGVNVTKFVPGEMAEYTATADIIPKVELSDFKNLGVKKPEVKVTDDDVKQMLDNLSEAFATKKVVRRAAKETDEVVIDFTGKKDGKAFQGGTAKDYKLVLGSHTFIPGFEEGIVGHEVGDKFNLDITFPKDYNVKDLAGAKTVFEVLLKQVNEITPAPQDDEMAKKCGPFKTIDELKADIKKNIAAQSEQRVMNQFKDDLVEALVKKSKVPAPEILVDDQLTAIRNDVTRNAQARDMEFEDFLKANGETMESWEKQAREIAEKRVKASLALQTLAAEQKITVDEADVTAKLAELKEIYKKSAEAVKNLKNPSVKNDIRNRMIIDKTLDFLAEANSSDSKPKKETKK
ncbi:trigger factor [Candidatus Saccharibacteria bacterium]|nr:trigger factor [Candidatus Saccharibacteria bacterium]